MKVKCKVCGIINNCTAKTVRCAWCEEDFDPATLKLIANEFSAGSGATHAAAVNIGKSARAEAGWVCPICTKQNNNSSAVCAGCYEKRPSVAAAAKTPPSDEWQCSACGKKNKTTNKRCVVCDTEAPNVAAVSSAIAQKQRATTNTIETTAFCEYFYSFINPQNFND